MVQTVKLRLGKQSKVLREVPKTFEDLQRAAKDKFGNSEYKFFYSQRQRKDDIVDDNSLLAVYDQQSSQKTLTISIAAETATETAADTANSSSNYSMEFVEHVKPLKNEFDPRSTIDKVWKVRNNGTNQWPRRCELKLKKGEVMNSTSIVPAAKPDECVDLKATLFLTNKYPSYQTIWTLNTPDGEQIGEDLTFDYSVFPPRQPR